jgi:hypothetical protein
LSWLEFSKSNLDPLHLNPNGVKSSPLEFIYPTYSEIHGATLWTVRAPFTTVVINMGLR